MNRLIPAFILGSMLLGGAAFAQSFEPPSIPDLSGIPDVGVPQIDPPSLQIDTGPSDANGDGDGDSIPDLAEIGETIAEAFDARASNETDPGVALLEFLGAVEEAVRSGLQQGRVLLDSDFGAAP